MFTDNFIYNFMPSPPINILFEILFASDGSSERILRKLYCVLSVAGWIQIAVVVLNKLVMSYYFTNTALVMHQYCLRTSPILPYYCTYINLLMRKKYPITSSIHISLVLHQYCPKTVSILPQYCTNTGLILYQYRPNTELILHQCYSTLTSNTNQNKSSYTFL